ncbi:hypothetical protein CANMA_005234 [Candida margitis]|uniref:uncharacterized protein n=1 Tax=Candida margitis TaxID=1775924 RepID=UPI002226C107|nr:uncharacterized protein CANMA_005234 [Candida margitis]KAI5950574.1 hypothetical protein CANMA_005234 [Candida margitis]
MKLNRLSLLYFTASAVVANNNLMLNVNLAKRSQDLAKREEAEAPLSDSNSDASLEQIELPPTLGKDEFDAVTSKNLVLVEFYSPYCSHCKSFFPTWQKAYRIFKTKFANLNTDMRQVNCIENGDLCERESIEFYPNILLYAPVLDKDGKPTGKSKNIGSFPRTLEKTEANLVSYIQESLADYDSESASMPSASKEMSVDEILKAVSGEITKPIFVSFWQATKKQWNSVDLGGKVRFSDNCIDCLHVKQLWDKLSNKIVSLADSGHFLCSDYPKVCEKLELDSFKDAKRSSPKFIMFLPKDRKAIRFDYDGPVDVAKMKWWVNKLFVNSAYEVVSAKGITEVMEFTKTLRHEPFAQNYPLKSKVTVVFFFDVNAVTPEDEAVLPYMLRTLQKSPFNIQLYKGKHNRILENIQTMGENLISYINYDESEKYEFNEAMQIATSITQVPTIVVLKENSLIPEIYQNFALEQMRKYDEIEKFLERAQYPFIAELTPELVSAYFVDPDYALDIADAKVVIIFVDLDNLKETDEALYRLSLVAHEYNFLKKSYYFNKILEQRASKEEEVEKLKAKNAETLKIMTAMRKQVPHLFNNDDVVFTFINKPTSKNFRYVKGWRIRPDDYDVGDAIVVSKDHRYFWDTDLNNKKLRNEPKQIKSVLMSLLHKDNNMQLKFVGSPYGGLFYFMNYVHDFGIVGYLGFIVVVYALIHISMRLRRRRYRSQGIIGVNNGAFLPKKSNKD